MGLAERTKTKTTSCQFLVPLPLLPQNSSFKPTKSSHSLVNQSIPQPRLLILVLHQRVDLSLQRREKVFSNGIVGSEMGFGGEGGGGGGEGGVGEEREELGDEDCDPVKRGGGGGGGEEG